MKGINLFLIVIIVLSINLINSLSVNIPIQTNYTFIGSNLTTNSSDYWDNLDTPADITYDDISGGDVNAAGYTGYFAFLDGTTGLLDMNGDPWYLGGTDLELGQELTVDGYSNLNNTYPLATLLYDLGSGALRWRWLYVQNISAENIDTYTIHATDNITTDDYFIGDGSYLTNINFIESDPAWNSNYSIFTGLINNASYLSTYNATYATWAYNQSDNLGNHIATQDLNMSGYVIYSVDKLGIGIVPSYPLHLKMLSTDEYAIKVDGTTNYYNETGTNELVVMDLSRSAGAYADQYEIDLPSGYPSYENYIGKFAVIDYRKPKEVGNNPDGVNKYVYGFYGSVINSVTNVGPTPAPASFYGYTASAYGIKGSAEVQGIHNWTDSYAAAYGIQAQARAASHSQIGADVDEFAFGVAVDVSLDGTEDAGTMDKTGYGISVSVGDYSTLTNGVSAIYGVYVDTIGSPADTNWAFYNNNDAINNFMGGDNSKSYFGTDKDAWQTWDGTNYNFNQTGNGVWTFYNSTGLGTIRYGKALTSTTINTDTDVLESFKLGSDLVDENGNPIHSEFGECYRQIEETDYNNCTEIYLYTDWIVKNKTDGRIIFNTRKEPTNEMKNEFNVEEHPVYHTECGTKLVDVVDLTCMDAKQSQALALLNRNTNLYENLTDFDTGIMAEDIFTQSEVITSGTDYLSKFTTASLSNKDTHKNKEVLDIKGVPTNVLNLEDRIVDLEGAVLELKQENQMLKDELCLKDKCINKYSWCGCK